MQFIAKDSERQRRDWRLWLFALIALIGFALSMTSVNIAFMLGFVTMPLGAITWGKRFFDKQRRDTLQRLVLYGSCALLVVSGPAGCALAAYRTETAFQPVITAVDAFYEQHKKYPKSLSELGIPIPICPDPAHEIGYSVPESMSYRLTCYTYVFNKHTYNSETRKWIDWD